MADGPFSSPLAGLALEMAVRNQQLLERVPEMTANQRNLINRRLTRYGGDISQYEPFMEVGYDPTVKAMQTTLEGQRDYLVGLPELMMKAAKEGAGTPTKEQPNTNPLQDYFNRILNNLYRANEPKTTVIPQVSPDTAERRIGLGQPASPWTSRPSSSPTARRTGTTSQPKITFGPR